MAHPNRWKVLVKEYPCLYDTKNPDFLNEELKERCFQRLLERCNIEGDQMDMELLKQRVSGFLIMTSYHNDNNVAQATATRSRQQTQNDLLLEIATNFPYLWNHSLPMPISNHSNDHVRLQSQELLLQVYNSKSGKNISMEELQQILKDVNLDLQLQCADSNDRLIKLAKKYPCLWNFKDQYYKDNSRRTRGWRQLLQEYNYHLEAPITMEQLKKKMYYLRFRLFKLSYMYMVGLPFATKDRFLELTQEFPCLWNSDDLNFRDENVRRRSYKQLLEKYNKESLEQITMVDLKRKIHNMTRRMKYCWASSGEEYSPESEKDRLLELALEFPYLWDPGHLNFRNGTLKRRGYQQLLAKYNDVAVKESAEQITAEDLKKKLESMRRRLKDRILRRRKGMKSRNDKGKRKIGKGRVPEKGQASNSSPQHQACDNMTQENSPEAEPLVLQGLEIVFNWCCFCGEIREDCYQVSHDQPYVTTNKIVLTMNDLSVEVDFRKHSTPQTICQSCDIKLQDMYEFVKAVQKTQTKFTNVSNIDEIRETPVILNEKSSHMSTSDGDDEKGDVIYDSLSISETEVTKKTVTACRRKNNKEVAASRKKFRVSIDLNSISSYCDDSNGSNYMDVNCNEETHTSVDAPMETTKEVNKSVIIKEEIIVGPRDIADREAFNTENAIQRTEKTQNTTTSSSETRNKLAIESNSVQEQVIDQEAARESISAVTNVGYTLNVVNEYVKSLFVKEDNELTNDIEKEIQLHTIRTHMQPSEVKKQVESEINSIAVTNNASPKQAITADDNRKVSENTEIVIKHECIVLSDDEDNNDAQLRTKVKLELTDVQNTQVLVSDASKLPGTSQRELSNDTTGFNVSRVPENPPSSAEVCVIPKSDLIELVESIVSRMLNK